MNIAIVGGGITGLTAAYRLLEAGHQVAIYEAGDHPGGLAAGFRDERWDWPLENFYHHLFTSDKHIIRLVEELNFRDRLYFPKPVTSVVYNGRIVPFDSPKAWITFPGFNMIDVARFGLVSAYLRFSSPWRKLESVSADSWMRRWYGEKVYEMLWMPLLIGKFGPNYRLANMAWMWARLKVRSPRLGYFRGGFQSFVDVLTAAVTKAGGSLYLNSPISNLQATGENQVALSHNDEQIIYDKCLVTTSPKQLLNMAPAISGEYRQKLTGLKSMGAVVLVLALRRQLMPKTYWLNLPATSADKTNSEYPFLALVEHTNYINRKHYGGDHLVYCGDYIKPDHIYFDMAEEEVKNLFIQVLGRFNPDFEPDWIRKWWLFRARYAQPVPELNHSQKIPGIQTPITNLYFASMSQVYPWDRGTNFAVEIGQRAAKLIAG